MKKISNVFKALFALAALTLLGSCSNDIKVNDSVDADKALVRINFSDNSRTVLPEYKISEFTDVKLTMETVDEDIELGSWETAAKADGCVIELDSDAIGHNYTFELTAKKGVVILAGTTRATIIGGENELKFALMPKVLGSGSGNGKLSYAFSFAEAENADDVTSVYINLLKGSTSVSTSFYRDVENNKINNNSVLYEQDDLSAGVYTLDVYIYDENSLQLLHWKEDVHIAEGLTSSATRSVDALNSVYTVTKYRNVDEVEAAAITKVTRSTISIYNSFTRKGYNFAGWYTDKACSDGKELTFPITSDITVYAKWVSVKNADGSYSITPSNASEVFEIITENETDNSKDKPVVLKLSGSLSTTSFGSIRDVLKNYNSKSETPVYYTLDFTNVTNSYYITTLTGCDTLTSITFNNIDGEYFGGYYFVDCTALKEIKIPSNATYFKNGSDGAVYDKDGKVLIVYPQAKTKTTFTIPSNVELISSGALLGGNISSFAVAAGNTAFKAVDGVLFSADERDLIAYPSGKTDKTSYVIPEKTLCIYAYAFAGNKTLTDVTFEADDAILKYATSHYSIASAWKYRNSYFYTPSEVSANLLSVFNANPNRFYYNMSFSCFTYGAEDVSVFDKENYYIDTTSYVITDFYSSIFGKWYKFTAEAGKSYKINWCDQYSPSYISYSYDGTLMSSSTSASNLGFTDGDIYVYKSDSTAYSLKDPFGNSVTNPPSSAKNEFIVSNSENEDETVYIFVSSGNYGKCAFRVRNYDPEAGVTHTLSATVEVGQADIEVTVTDRGNYITFAYSDYNYVKRQWYVDGEETSTSNSINFWLSDYSKGTHLVTLEVKKSDGVIYSYSAQVKIK